MRDINTQQHHPLPVIGSARRRTIPIPVRGQPYGVFYNTTGPESDFTAAGGWLKSQEIGGTGKSKAR